MKHIFLLFCLFFLLCKFKAFGSMDLDSITGIYKCGNENLYLNLNTSSFCLKRSLPKFQDVGIPICYDTIAKGSFKMKTKNLFILFNDKNFMKTDFNIEQENKLSDDSIYFQIIIPKDDAFSSNRFRYYLNGFSGAFYINSEKSFIKIPKRKGIKYGTTTTSLNFLIRDLLPQDCSEEEKCYQRICFRIFNDFLIDGKSNFFTIMLPNFTECYVERMDVDGDFIFFDGKSIFWRGKEYKKIS